MNNKQIAQELVKLAKQLMADEKQSAITEEHTVIWMKRGYQLRIPYLSRAGGNTREDDKVNKEAEKLVAKAVKQLGQDMKRKIGNGDVDITAIRGIV